VDALGIMKVILQQDNAKKIDWVMIGVEAGRLLGLAIEERSNLSDAS